MPKINQVPVALLIEDSDAKNLVEDTIESDPKKSANVALKVDQAALVIVDYDDPLNSIPLPERVNQAQGKPIIAVSKSIDHYVTRRLFIEGAADVIPFSDVSDQLIVSIQRLAMTSGTGAMDAGLLGQGLAYFREISELAGSGKDLDTFFDRIVAVVAEIMDVQIVSLMLLNERFKTLWIASAIGLDEEIVRSTSVQIGEGISGKVAQQGRPLMIQDVELDPKLAVSKSSDRYNTKGFLSVPIMVRGKVIGVININNKKSGAPFREADLNIMMMLAHQAGLAIENARLFADLQSKAASLEQAYNELKRINLAKTQLIVNLSHEIKTPLTAIIGYVDLLLSGTEDISEKTQRSLEKISTRGRHLNRLAERIITYFALQTKSIDWLNEMVPLNQLVFTAVDQFKETANERNVTLVVDGPSISYDVFCDIAHMQEVFLNIIENAILFNKKGGYVNIHGETLSKGRRAVRIHIQDTGAGVPESIAGKIFDGFFQTENVMSDKPEGLGIGLAMSKSIVEAHSGLLELTSNSKNGATFSVTLPLK